jgi:hypothetical protein
MSAGPIERNFRQLKDKSAKGFFSVFPDFPFAA